MISGNLAANENSTCFLAMSGALIPLHSPVLLGIFRDALETSLIERGAAQAIELLGPADEFWRCLPLSELMRMAEAGNPKAQAELAWRYAVGEGVDKSHIQAARWATLSAERNCASGEAVLGWLLYHGFGLPKDQIEAAVLFERAAAHEDLRGLTWFGLCLLRGHGVSEDAPRALSLLRKSAGRNGETSRLAQYWLGRVLYFGQGNSVPRCCFFGRGMAENRAEAVRLWRIAAEAGSGAAMYCVGMCLFAGEGAPQDFQEATIWFRAAARKRISGAMFLLGQCAVSGCGVSRDFQAGLGWYRRAAELGNRDAEFELGEWHAFGRGGLQQDIATVAETVLQKTSLSPSPGIAVRQMHTMRLHMSGLANAMSMVMVCPAICIWQSVITALRRRQEMCMPWQRWVDVICMALVFLERSVVVRRYCARRRRVAGSRR